MTTMDNPLEMLLPLVGFAGGLLFWSRIAHLGIALSGLTPNPAKPRDDIEALITAHRRLVLRIAAAWMVLVAALIAYLLYHEKTGFAALFAGVEVVPLFTVTYFLSMVRRFRRRAAAAKSKASA